MKNILFVSSLLFLLLLGSCKKEYIPKPRGYFRIDFPEKAYMKIDPKSSVSAALPYRFEIPVYSKLVADKERIAEPYWTNLIIQSHKAEVHLSYKKVDHNLLQLTEDARTLAYKHSIKADAINERVFINAQKKVYGTIYLIDGNAASPLQFFLTDSTTHFLRGALYISEVPNIDSIRPVIQFLTPDVIHLIETTEWTH
ncbi:MAG TPA: gliding motility lipoprotein GldD [Prolixibacteraceae bacterium]|jgi:gliding motility-associated lipoprotein GldD|nr:gliding motility lipoprotein GldD [Prolixibacteraceae bacterium]